MGDRSLLNALLVLVATAALGVASVLAVAPERVPATVLEPLATFERETDSRTVVIGIGAVVGAFALWRGYRSGGEDVSGHSIRATDDADSAPVLGERTTDRVETIVADLKRGRDRDPDSIAESIRSVLRTVELDRGYAAETAERRIQRGDWTDDPVAAAFVGDETAGTLTLFQRVRGWLFPAKTFERRLDRTLSELERYVDRAAGTPAADPDSGGSDETVSATDPDSAAEPAATRATTERDEPVSGGTDA